MGLFLLLFDVDGVTETGFCGRRTFRAHSRRPFLPGIRCFLCPLPRPAQEQATEVQLQYLCAALRKEVNIHRAEGRALWSPAGTSK